MVEIELCEYGYELVKKTPKIQDIGWYYFILEGNKTWNIKTKWTFRDFLVIFLSLYLLTNIVLPNWVLARISNLRKIIISVVVIFSVTDMFAIVIIDWNNVNSSGCQHEEKLSVKTFIKT